MITKFDKSFIKKSVKVYAVAVILVVLLFVLKSIFLQEKSVEEEEFRMSKKIEVLHVEKTNEENTTKEPKILLFK